MIRHELHPKSGNLRGDAARTSRAKTRRRRPGGYPQDDRRDSTTGLGRKRTNRRREPPTMVRKPPSAGAARSHATSFEQVTLSTAALRPPAAPRSHRLLERGADPLQGPELLAAAEMPGRNTRPILAPRSPSSFGRFSRATASPHTASIRPRTCIALRISASTSTGADDASRASRPASLSSTSANLVASLPGGAIGPVRGPKPACGIFLQRAILRHLLGFSSQGSGSREILFLWSPWPI